MRRKERRAKRIRDEKRNLLLAMVRNKTIMVYDFVDGVEVNRRRPDEVQRFDRLGEILYAEMVR